VTLKGSLGQGQRDRFENGIYDRRYMHSRVVRLKRLKRSLVILLRVVVYCCRLTIEYILYCDDNYYSSDCSVYCVANDTDADGHYTCDPITGNITCRPGMLSGR